MGQRRGHQSVKDVTEPTDSRVFLRKDFTALVRLCLLASCDTDHGRTGAEACKAWGRGHREFGVTDMHDPSRDDAPWIQ